MPGKRVNSATFRGKRWAVTARPMRKYAGMCDPPTTPLKCIWLDTSCGQYERLVTAIHEALHACHWDLDEQAIDETAVDVARFLTRLRRAGHLE